MVIKYFDRDTPCASCMIELWFLTPPASLDNIYNKLSLILNTEGWVELRRLCSCIGKEVNLTFPEYKFGKHLTFTLFTHQ